MEFLGYIVLSTPKNIYHTKCCITGYTVSPLPILVL